jgi:hypothetical protein
MSYSPELVKYVRLHGNGEFNYKCNEGCLSNDLDFGQLSWMGGPNVTIKFLVSLREREESSREMTA